MRILRKFSLFLAYLGLFMGISLSVSAKNKAFSYRTGIQPMNVSRFVLETKENPSYNIFYLDNPKRVVIDVKNLDISKTKEEDSNKSGFIKDIRMGNFDGDDVRFVLDLSSAAKVKKHFVLNPISGNSNYRLVLDIEKTSNLDFSNFVSKKTLLPSDKSLEEDVIYEEVEVTSSSSSKKFTKKLPVKKNTPKIDKPKIIVIDAGHGGTDPGAIGSGGTYEKDIVLAMAKQLRDVLKKNPEYTIVMTRETDKFIKLQERAKIGEKNNATFFISIHADSSPRKTTKGFSVYTLSEKATDEESKKIAEKENAADLLGVGTFDAYDAVTKNILGDLMQTQVKIASVELADEMVRQVKQDIVCVDNPHREAPFTVLRSAVPSVLVEMGFLSNKDEERKLKQKWYREKLAYSLARSIDAILKE